jgi:hypothetical protein
MNSLEFLYKLSRAKSNPLKLDSFAALPVSGARAILGVPDPCFSDMKIYEIG